MKKNSPISDLHAGDDVCLHLTLTSIRDRRSQQGKRFVDAPARNATGALIVRVWSELLERAGDITAGLWEVTGRVESFAGQLQLTASEYVRLSLDDYRTSQGSDPALPMAYTIDIETIALPKYSDRVPVKLERAFRLGKMDAGQEERYLSDRPAEEERVYRSGGLAATSGRILSIAVHRAPVPGIRIEGLEQGGAEYVFGIDADCRDEGEVKALDDFLKLIAGFDAETDDLVGHNIIGFDLPFIYQRCLVHRIPARPVVSLAEYSARGVFDTMHRWWLGARNRVSLDDLAWALGLESSKTEEVDGSRIFDLYHAGKLAEIREYNLNDVRLTRRVYERMVAVFGR